MAEVFLNSAATGAGDGTSEADAYTDFETAVNGLTYGDTLWIKNSGTTYGITADGSAVDLSHLDVSGTSNVNLVKFIGYDSVTGDNPVGDNRPVITRTPNTHNSFYVSFPESAYVSNLRFDFEANTYQYNYPDEFRFGGNSEILNTKFTVRDPGTYMNPRAVPVVIYNGSLIQGCEFDYQVTTENTSTRDRYYLLSIGSVDNKWFDCVFKTASDINFMGNYTFGYQNEKMRGCIFVGNGNNSFFNIAYTNAHNWRSGYRITLDNCIFYNCGNAITVNAPTTTTTGTDTDVEWSYARGLVSVRNCMFENCLVGVDVPDYADPSSWVSGTFTMTHVVRVEKCGFYNNTTANTRGDMTEIETINLTASPFVDAANDDFAINEVAGGGKVIREQSAYEIPVFGGASVMKLFSGSVLEKDFTTTDTGSFDGRTGGVGDTITTSGRSFQLVQDNPRVWKRVRV